MALLALDMAKIYCQWTKFILTLNDNKVNPNHIHLCPFLCEVKILYMNNVDNIQHFDSFLKINTCEDITFIQWIKSSIARLKIFLIIEQNFSP